MISRRSFLMRPGLGLRGRRELIRRGRRGGGGLPSPVAGRGCGRPGREPARETPDAVAALGDPLAANAAEALDAAAEGVAERPSRGERLRSSAAGARAPTRSRTSSVGVLALEARRAPRPGQGWGSGDAKRGGGPPWRSCAPRRASGGRRVRRLARAAGERPPGVKSSSPRLSQSPCPGASGAGALPPG